MDVRGNVSSTLGHLHPGGVRACLPLWTSVSGSVNRVRTARPEGAAEGLDEMKRVMRLGRAHAYSCSLAGRTSTGLMGRAGGQQRQA